MTHTSCDSSLYGRAHLFPIGVVGLPRRRPRSGATMTFDLTAVGPLVNCSNNNATCQDLDQSIWDPSAPDAGHLDLVNARY